MTAPITGRQRSIQILDSFIWYGYLLLLATVSLVNNYYNSEIWLQLSACAYVLCGLFSISWICGGCCNSNALAQAKYVTMILAAMLLLLVLQITLPIGKHTELLLLKDSLFTGVAPDWFEPRELWSIVPEKTSWLLRSEVLMFSVFVLSTGLLCTRRRLKQLLTVFLFVALGHSLIAIFAKYGGVILVDVSELDGNYGAARGWFVNRNHFAAFVSMNMVGALAFILKELMSRSTNSVGHSLVRQLLTYRIVAPLALIVGMIALTLSQSRAGFLSFLGASFLVFCFFSKLGLGLSRRRIIFAVALIVISLVAVVTHFGAELLPRFTLASPLGERVPQWSVTWDAIKRAWILGYGGNSYADVFQIVRGDQDFRQVIFNQSHNDYLHIWLEQGLLGLTLWLSFLALVLKGAYKGAAKSSSALAKAILMSTIIVVLAALIQSIVDFNLQMLNIRYYFFVILSLAFSVPAIKRKKSSSKNQVLV